MTTEGIAVVSGGTRGIGAAISMELAAHGRDVVALYRSRSEDADRFLKECEARGLRVTSRRVDVSDPDEVRSVITDLQAEHGPVGVLVHNAGIREDGLLVRMTDDAWARVIATNLSAAFYLARSVLPGMMRRRQGRIVNIASPAAYVGAAGQANYAAAKAGLVGLSRAIAREMGSRSITCNVVSPGPVDTEMISDLNIAQRAALAGLAAAGRLGEAQEVAHTVAFLCSDEAAYITGAVLPVDGGLGMGL